MRDEYRAMCALCPNRSPDGCRPHRGCLAQMEVHYQPIVRLGTGRIVGAEALVRCRPIPTGLLPPGEFIPDTEHSGFIHELGAWVLDRALTESAAWRAGALLSVNVSPVQMLDPMLSTKIGQLLKAAHRPAHRLVVEVTETAKTPEKAMAVETLRASGIKLALDDFGTGFATLDTLRRSTFDYLKLPREFVSGIAGTSAEATIARAIIGLAGSLGIEVIAEGIESTEQAIRLQQLGCQFGQGFLYSRPVPAAAFANLPEPIGSCLSAKVGTGRRALVVDDEDPVRRALVRILEGVAFEVTQVKDGRTALEAAADTRPDLAVIDLELPDIPGREVLRRLRSGDVPRLPVIHISGNAVWARDRARGMVAGAIAYLTKPIVAGELIATADAVLRAA